jgi:hypothetical protein
MRVPQNLGNGQREQGSPYEILEAAEGSAWRFPEREHPFLSAGKTPSSGNTRVSGDVDPMTSEHQYHNDEYGDEQKRDNNAHTISSRHERIELGGDAPPPPDKSMECRRGRVLPTRKP